MKKQKLLNLFKFTKTSDIYFNRLYTVIPKDVDASLGVFPSDQGFNDKYVFLWNDYYDLYGFDDDKWKRISVVIPQDIKYLSLHKLVGSAFILPYLSNHWQIEEVTSPPRYAK